jgi:hypothetical protein
MTVAKETPEYKLDIAGVNRTVDSNTHREAEKNNTKIGPVNVTT